MTEGTTPAADTAKAKKAEPTIVKVTMDDGREVEFKGKAKMNKEVFEKEGQLTARFDFINGETAYCVLPSVLVLKAAGHGILQKIGDAGTKAEDIDDLVETIRTECERLAAAQSIEDWNKVREAGDGLAGAGMLVKALIEVTGKAGAEVRAMLANLDRKTQNAMMEAEIVRPVIARLRAEKAAKAKKDPTVASGAAAALAALLGAPAETEPA